MRSRRVCTCRRLTAACLALVVWLGAACIALAGDQESAPAAARSHRDYDFGLPEGTLGLRGSWQFARAGSDLFDFVTEQLTLERSAFDAPAFGADLTVTLTPRLDLVFGLESSFASSSSEYRDYVDNNRLPITQETSLRELDLTAGVKVFLRPRGRRISRFAWIAGTVAPYVGGGVGRLKYDFKQKGDFVDFVDLSVFSATFQSEGWTWSGHVCGGIDVRAYRRLYITGEGRYVFASGDLDSDFVGFEPMDLCGFRLGAGVWVIF